MAGDLMLRVKFAGTDGLSRVLDNLTSGAKRAGRAIVETNRSIRDQKRELREVEAALKAGSGDTRLLEERQRSLTRSIAGSNTQLDRQRRLFAIDARTARARTIGRDMVASGQMTIASTMLVAAPMIAMAKVSADFQSLQNRMKVLGLGTGAVDDLTAFARAMNVAGSSVNENMRYLLEAQGVFRESGEHSMADQLAGAKLMGPLLAKMSVTAKAMGKEISEDQERYFLRFVEQAGGLASPKRAAELTDGLFRALQSSGGNVQAENYQSFLARAGIAGSHLSNRSMFADFEPLIAELHDQAGVGLSTGFKMATGIKVNSRAAAEFMKLGIWDRSKVELNSLGGVKSTKGNPLNTRAADLLAHDPVEFYRQIVMPAYAKGGIATSEQRAFENAKLFGGTGGNLFNLIDKQLPTIIRSRGAFQKTQGLETAYQSTNNSFFGQEGKLRAAGQNFMVAAGTKGGLLDNLVTLMNGATAALTTFTNFGNAHPTAFAWLGTIVTNLLLMRVGLAVVKIAFGGLLGPVASAWGLFQKWRLAGSIAAAFPRVAGFAGILRTAFLFLGRGMLQAGLMMLANPMVLAIVAVGAALGVLGYLAYKHWDTIKGAFSSAWKWLTGLVPQFKSLGMQLFDGLVSMLNPAAFGAKLIALGKTAVSSFIQGVGNSPIAKVMLAAASTSFVGGPLAAAAVGAAVRPAAQAKPTAKAAPVTVNVHPHPHQSAEDIAHHVKKVIDDHHAAQARNARASYRDTD